MKPILFNTPMIQAILEGRKTQTRRVIKIIDDLELVELEKDPITIDKRRASGERIKPGLHAIFEDFDGNLYAEKAKCEVGDVLWAQETWTHFCINKVTCRNSLLAHSDYCYKASENNSTIYGCCDNVGGCKWRPSIHMPRKAARIFLHITDVRVERVQDITAEDCLREGVEREAMEVGAEFTTGIFHGIWDDLYAKDGYGWNANPWVFVYGFERIEKPK